MQQQLLLSLWLSQIAQGYRFSVATPLLCLKQIPMAFTACEITRNSRMFSLADAGQAVGFVSETTSQ